MELKVPQILWQLLMEKEFLSFLNSSLVPESMLVNQSTADGTRRELSNIGKNAVRYTAGSVIHKLKERYKKDKTKEGIECLTVLNNMGSKIQVD